MNLDKMIAQMRQDHEEIGIAIKWFERLAGDGKPKQKVSTVERAAKMIAETHGHETKAATNGNGNGHEGTEHYAAIAKAIDKGMPLADAVMAALRASSEPISPAELAPILRRRGVVGISTGKPIDSRGLGIAMSYIARDNKAIRAKKVFRASKRAMVYKMVATE